MEQTDTWRNALRKDMRAQRTTLDNASLDSAELCVCEHLSPELNKAQHIAAYIAIDGELPLGASMRYARSQGSKTYVPVVREHSMIFVRIDDNTAMTRNRFGIEEPADLSDSRSATQMDLVLVPLVAFDTQGNRLGMGGGYYDRTFESAQQRPRLIGIAHDFQRVAELQAMPWDVPLDAVVTESGFSVSR